MIYYAIRHRGNGRYMGLPCGRYGRGGTHAELVDHRKAQIRLFNTSTGALNALHWWSKGKVEVIWDWEDGEQIWRYNLTDEREREVPHMEIVAMKITPIEAEQTSKQRKAK
jgi:hypothetical protein